MLRIKEDDISNMYFVTSADWEACVVSTSFDKAVSKALSKLFKEYGKNLKLSPAIIVVDTTNYCINFSEDHTKVFSTSMVLSDIGEHSLAKKFKKIVPDA
tara:strand:- start:418 stop:717 length:300 start_codon:yes stop_codon:yes gene_type:complete